MTKGRMSSISTIIPTYNSARTIEETLISVLKQKRKSDEIIVVDDGSTDSTDAIVKKYPDVTYIKKSNAGVSMARNLGARKAFGRWIAFCDSDDIWHPEKLAIIERCIEKCGSCRFLFHNFYPFGDSLNTTFSGVGDHRDTIFPFFNENKISIKEIFSSHENIYLTDFFWPFAPLYHGAAFRWLLLGNFILPSSVVIRRDFFEDSGGFDPEFRSAEDTEFFMRLSKETIFYYIDLPLTGYRRSHDSLSSNTLVLLNYGMKALYKNAVLDLTIYKNYKRVINLSIARRYGRYANFYLFNGKRLYASKMALKGLKYCFYVWQIWAVLVSLLLPVQQLSKIKRKIRP